MSTPTYSADANLPPLQWQQMPLQGRVLIEASAGTGKTWNIGLIYLRLLLERELRVEQILVTTFTDAAAQELRERLRRRLVEAERWLGDSAQQARQPEEDSLEDYLKAKFSTNVAPALRRIQIARTDFDRAPIATFHALCQRIQRDFPLQSSAAISADKLLDERALLQECVEDFWRRRYLDHAVDGTEFDTVVRFGPQGLMRDLGSLLTRRDLVVAADGAADLGRQVAQLSTRASIAELRRLGSDKSLYAARKHALKDRFSAIADILQAGVDVQSQLDKKLDKCFDVQYLLEQQAAGAPISLVEHALVRALQTLRAAFSVSRNFARGQVLVAAAAYCRQEIPRRARQRDAQTFSMLIDNVHARLYSAAGDAALADSLFKAFPAALIDEFQDTDRRQFEIFDRIYRNGEKQSRGTLVMIGDPKQAIYAFRGGDIAAYLRASEQVDVRYSLGVNHRSSAALITAINALYAHTGGGFDDPRIRYRQVQASARNNETAYALAGVPVATPMSLHRFRGGAVNAKGEPLSTLVELEKLALKDCADRIVALLNDARRTIGGRRVSPGDIAVLVPTNAQIAELRRLLSARDVPCVGSGRASVFDSEIARDLDLVLFAVVNADDDRAVRGALSTRLLGAKFADFLHWQDDVQQFERELERFANWRELCRTRGILALIESLLSYRGAWLLTTADGERAITDLRHLGELLADEEGTLHGLAELYAWFSSMRREGASDGDSDAAEGRQLRIESDARRVQLLTLHASKGLEFPIVFLPLAWRISAQHTPNVLHFHDDDERGCIDLGSARFTDHRARHFREDLQERLRQFYVAATRAKYALHVYWVDRGAVQLTDENAWNVAAIDLLIGQVQDGIGADNGEAGLHTLAAMLDGFRIEEAFSPAFAKYHAPDPSRAPRLARTPLPALRAFQWLHSFSGLIRQARAIDGASGLADPVAAEFVADVDDIDLDRADEADDPRLLALYPLRGPRFGDAVHNILEQAQTGPLWPQQRALLAAQLTAQALRIRHEPAVEPLELVGRLVDRVRAADLGEGVRLDSLPVSARVAEFEFQFPVQRVSVARLRALCSEHGLADVVPAALHSVTLNGMLTGFADLVFVHAGRYHVMDYKTNWLGARLSDYAGEALDAAMAEHHYDLQALIYTLALHRYLQQRLDGYTPERHLGESWYLFLRGVGLQPGLGVWRRQWPAGLILALDNAFAGATGVAA